jgi:hypothetical protein
MDLCGESTLATSKSLCFLTTAFPQSSSSTGINTDNGAVAHGIFHIGLIDEILMCSLKDTLVTQAGKPLADTIPLAALFRKQSSLGSTIGHPKECFDEPAVITLVFNVNFWTGTKGLQDLQQCIVLKGC